VILWGAVAQAQEPRDTLPRAVPLPAADSMRADSARADSVPPRDTIKAPIARAPRSTAPEISGRRVIWDRDAIFASGAVTLPDLLAQVPGVTTLHAGFIAAVSATSWYGEPGRVRVYLDDVEIDPLDARSGGVADLSIIQIWSLEEVAVERMAGELRVHLRSWRVERTTAQTRTDVTTGSENTNLYRGFFGKRLNNGGVLQVAAQQYSTTSVRTRGDGDALAWPPHGRRRGHAHGTYAHAHHPQLPLGDAGRRGDRGVRGTGSLGVRPGGVGGSRRRRSLAAGGGGHRGARAGDGSRSPGWR
jgi:hypothetical protein